MRYRPHLDNRGSMMVEAIVSILLLGVSMAAISALITQHIQQSGKTNKYTTAITLAEQELEDMRSQDYTTGIVSRTSTTTWGSAVYTVTTNVVNNTPATNVKQLTTTVSWMALNGSQTYTLYSDYTDLQH